MLSSLKNSSSWAITCTLSFWFSTWILTVWFSSSYDQLSGPKLTSPANFPFVPCVELDTTSTPVGTFPSYVGTLIVSSDDLTGNEEDSLANQTVASTMSYT